MNSLLDDDNDDVVNKIAPPLRGPVICHVGIFIYIIADPHNKPFQLVLLFTFAYEETEALRTYLLEITN